MFHALLMSRGAAALLTMAAALLIAPVRAGAAPDQRGGHALLDVPYVSQTPELCGGAAVAMVLRYWGEREVFPQDFAPLVVASERGIPAGSLVLAVRERQWQAVVLQADAANGRARIREAVDQGQPLIALIEVSARTYHFVVVVGATDHEVVLHDPARAPFQVLRWDEFDRRWATTSRWAMLVLPPGGGRRGAMALKAAPEAAAAGAAKDPTSCDALVEHGIGLALGGDTEAAEQSLLAATRVCPASAAAWRELAGWRFSQSRWAEAQELARVAVRLSPDDTHARQLLATSRYLSGDVMGALDAWTPVGEPRIDAVAIHGADRTPHPVVVRAAGLQPRQVLTSAVFRRALHRLRDLPVASAARMQYEPLAGGLATVDVSITERPAVPSGWLTFANLGVRAVLSDAVAFDVSGVLGSGERMSVAWRWDEERPRVAFGLAFPSPPGLPGVVSLETAWDRQSYPSAGERRRRTALQLSDWSASWLRWETGVALDRFDDRGHASLEAGLEVRLAGDRVALAASGSGWVPLGGGRRFGTAGFLSAWRSSDDAASPAWSALAELTFAHQAAPLAVWEGAGTGRGRAGLLRAHPLLRDGVMTGPVFGRRVARGTLEYARPVGHALARALSIAVFADAAQAWRRQGGIGRSHLYVDAGGGLRVRIPGRAEVLRIDLAHGLRGGGAAASVSWLRAWPR